jgi:hypothetical protein
MATTQGEIRVGPGNQVKDIYVRETDNTVTFNQNFLFEIRVDTRHDVVSPLTPPSLDSTGTYWHVIYLLAKLHDFRGILVVVYHNRSMLVELVGTY